MSEEITRQNWDKSAALYESKFGNEDTFDEWITHFCNEITMVGAHILDVGCGPGIVTKKLLEYRPDFQVLGIDYAPSMINLAAKKVPEAKFLTMNLEELGHLDEKFHGVMASFCIPYVSPEGVKEFIKNAGKVLYPDGVLYLSFIEKSSMLSQIMTSSNKLQMTMHYYTSEWIKAELANLGFEIIKRFELPGGQEGEAYVVFICQRTN